MNKIIETERLLLRELDISDAEHFFKLNSDSEVLRYTGDKPFLSILVVGIIMMEFSKSNQKSFLC